MLTEILQLIIEMHKNQQTKIMVFSLHTYSVHIRHSQTCCQATEILQLIIEIDGNHQR